MRGSPSQGQPLSKGQPRQGKPLDRGRVHGPRPRSDFLGIRPFQCAQKPGGDSNFSMLLTLNYESRKVNLGPIYVK